MAEGSSMKALHIFAIAASALVLGQVMAWQLIWMDVASSWLIRSPGWWPRMPSEVVDGRWLGFSIISTLLTGVLILIIRALVRQWMEKAWRL